MSEIIICSNCQSSNIDSHSSCTEMYCLPFIDDVGKEHDHDENTFNENNECIDCHHTWEINIPHTCWCGWIQNVPNSGYNGPCKYEDEDDW